MITSVKQLLTNPKKQTILEELYQTSAKYHIIRVLRTPYSYRILQPPPRKPSQQWYTTLNNQYTTAKSDVRIRLLVDCDGLETDVSRFHYRYNGPSMESGNPTCKLCHSKPDDPSHFILHCPFFASNCQELLSDIPAHVKLLP